MAPALRVARRGGALLYDFEGLRTFKAKLRPGSWSSISLSYPPTQGAAVSIADALAAFTRGGVARFAMRSLVRGPRAVLNLLAGLLVPWTALLALAPAERWFPSPAVKWAWVGFDVVLALGLFRVLRVRSRRLTGALAIAVGLDALLTLTQAALWNVARVRGPLDAIIVLAACVGPVLGALALWWAYRAAGRSGG